jgi:hypothetical protein
VGDYLFCLLGPPFDFEHIEPVFPNETFTGQRDVKVGDIEAGADVRTRVLRSVSEIGMGPVAARGSAWPTALVSAPRAGQ